MKTYLLVHIDLQDLFFHDVKEETKIILKETRKIFTKMSLK